MYKRLLGKSIVILLSVISLSFHNINKPEVNSSLVEDDFSVRFYNNFCLLYHDMKSGIKYEFSHIDENNIVHCKMIYMYDKELKKEIPRYNSRDPLKDIESHQLNLEKEEVSNDI